MRERRRRYGILTAIVLAAGLTFGAPNPSRAQETGDIPSTATVEEQYQAGFEAYHRKNYKVAFDLLSLFADEGDTEALLAIGFIHQLGLDGRSPDEEKAFELFQEAASLGSDHARFQIAAAIDSGVGVRQDRIKARALFKDLANCGMIYGHFFYGFSLATDETRKNPDFHEAVKHYRIAANFGDPKAQVSLAHILVGDLKNLVEGWRWMAIAANSGEADAIKAFRDRHPHRGYIENAILYAEQWQGPEPPPTSEFVHCRSH